MTIETRELRQQVPVTILNWLDGMAQAKDVTRTDLVNAILQREVDEFHRVQTVVAQFTRGNGIARSGAE